MAHRFPGCSWSLYLAAGPFFSFSRVREEVDQETVAMTLVCDRDHISQLDTREVVMDGFFGLWKTGN